MFPLIGMIATAIGSGGSQGIGAYSRLKAIRENNAYGKSLAQALADNNAQALKAQNETASTYQRQLGVVEPTQTAQPQNLTTAVSQVMSEQPVKIPPNYQGFLNEINKLGNVVQ